MAQERQDQTQHPDAGESQEQGSNKNSNTSDEVNKETPNPLRRLSLLNNHRIASQPFDKQYTIDLKEFVYNSAGEWNGVLMQRHQPSVEHLPILESTRVFMPIWSGGKPHQEQKSTANPHPFLASATEAVRQAQIQVAKAQEQLKQAQEVEQAMLELAQLREVRKAHDELYGPNKPAGLTAAQEYLAFKKNQREQQSTPQ